MMLRSSIVFLAAIFLLCRLQTVLGVTTLELVDPASGSFIDNFLGAKNITIFCQVRETALIRTVWLLRTKDDIQNYRQPDSVSGGDDRFILTGAVIESGGFDVILETNLTIVEMTAELDGAVIFCGGGDENFLGNFSLRAYKPPLLNDAVLITERENVRFRVDLSEGNRPAFPFPSSFTWSRTGGVAVENATGRVYEYPSVTIQSVQPSDTGNYTLTATNSLPDGTPVGTDSGSFSLDVLFGASLTRGDMTVAVVEGRTVSLLCGRELKGNPTPRVEWRNNAGVRISNGGRYTFSMRQEVRLATADTVRGDAGNWTCRAQVFQNGTIEVGDAVEYSVQLVVVVPPAAPEDLAVDQTIGFTWISLSWQQSSTRRGIPPLSRHIILVSDSKREWNVTVEGSQAHANVTDLLPGTEYSLRVVAVSTSGGVSAESPASAVLMATTRYFGFLAPEHLLADHTIGFTWISFSWQQSSTRRGIPPLSRHIILVSDSKREWNVMVEGSQARANVTDLLPGTEYSLRVVAVLTFGSVPLESPASAVLVATTHYFVPPTIVGEVTFTNNNPVEGEETTATCSWRGDPNPTVQWLKDDIVLKESDLPDHISISTLASGMGSELDFSSVRLEDAGDYMCNVTNLAASAYQVKRLKVMSKSDKSTSATDIGIAIGLSTLGFFIFLSVTVIIGFQCFTRKKPSLLQRIKTNLFISANEAPEIQSKENIAYEMTRIQAGENVVSVKSGTSRDEEDRVYELVS